RGRAGRGCGLMPRSLQQIATAAKKAAQKPRPATAPNDTNPAGSPGEMLVESLEGCRPKPVRWLVPGRVPAGMMGLIAGEGGRGKSVTPLELAAAVSVGRCALGLDYSDPVKGKALIISCEDDWERTVAPRLAVLGADFRNILRVRGVKSSAGAGMIDFHLGHF